MKRIILLAGILAFTGFGAMASDHEIPQKRPNISGIGFGKALYDKFCASCHGTKMKGTKKGPPFLHRIYHPGHHADGSFYVAVQRGTRQHHWKFGNMEPVTGVSQAMVASIVQYVRFMQKQAGIF
ncbi:MAG: c-type cytochrome [Rhodospirillales bacterium]|jgi:cytochrome c2|nr:cytochrome C [Rhodospirillaceae bacterium]MDP6430280.1 c-type cytochrome [Rhodospirillales bacterium]MDP6643913.1 c-type cytochrome [Rhodospirillales bacterium]MDP6841347.1 c-type cytochrome [Rhodospirillales bacterium]|tara:strand:+ start:186 stop:560 length:375 start_codon:yes stop_codon:yes gene_type:complete